MIRTVAVQSAWVGAALMWSVCVRWMVAHPVEAGTGAVLAVCGIAALLLPAAFIGGLR